jgi:hypothetical protein
MYLCIGLMAEVGFSEYSGKLWVNKVDCEPLQHNEAKAVMKR